MLKLELVEELLLKKLEVLVVIHFFNDLAPLPLFNAALGYFFHEFLEIFFFLVWILLSDHSFKQCLHSVSHCLLYEPELFIALIAQNLAKQSHFMVFLAVLLDACDDGSRPLDDEGLKAIPLV